VRHTIRGSKCLALKECEMVGQLAKRNGVHPIQIHGLTHVCAADALKKAVSNNSAGRAAGSERRFTWLVMDSATHSSFC